MLHSLLESSCIHLAEKRVIKIRPVFFFLSFPSRFVFKILSFFFIHYSVFKEITRQLTYPKEQMIQETIGNDRRIRFANRQVLFIMSRVGLGENCAHRNDEKINKKENENRVIAGKSVCRWSVTCTLRNMEHGKEIDVVVGLFGKRRRFLL